MVSPSQAENFWGCQSALWEHPRGNSVISYSKRLYCFCYFYEAIEEFSAAWWTSLQVLVTLMWWLLNKPYWSVARVLRIMDTRVSVLASHALPGRFWRFCSDRGYCRMRHLVTAFCDGRDTNKSLCIGILKSLLKIFLHLLLSEVVQETDRKKQNFPKSFWKE